MKAEIREDNYRKSPRIRLTAETIEESILLEELVSRFIRNYPREGKTQDADFLVRNWQGSSMRR